MKNLLRNAREAKSLKTRELAQLSGIDQALISKFESGTRTPTKAQVKKLSGLLDIDFEPFMLLWLKEKILHEIKNEALGLKALKSRSRTHANTCRRGRASTAIPETPRRNEFIENNAFRKKIISSCFQVKARNETPQTRAFQTVFHFS
jgi:transcriptional regulator with XRE-family HTH domain